MPEENINVLEDGQFSQNEFNLNDSFKYISENYEEVARGTNKVSKENYSPNQLEFFNFFVCNFKNYLDELSNNVSNKFVVEMSHKEGTLMVLPYYGFSFDKKDDFFIYYLFSYDFSEIYLTLGLKVEGKEISNIYEKACLFKEIITKYCGNNDIINENTIVNLKVSDLLEDLKNEIKTKRRNGEHIDDLIKKKNRLYAQKNNAKNYENATIFAKKYDTSNMPHDDELKKDLFKFLEAYKFIKENKLYDKFNEEEELKHNLIYFGAPGTGKSFKLNDDKSKLFEDEENYERVTFHPDYSYANFVGTYKPISDDNGNIKYKYVAGPFMRILKEAINEEDKNYLLIIEEINRANVAAVFGDVFQLLDRGEDNYSLYEISLSKEASDYLGEKKIKIPSNLYIWATMNSADQGVFPMDTAFKRRWDFEYLDINNNHGKIKNLKFILNDGEIYSWNNLREAINEELLKNNVNEDKLIGPFFAFNEFIDDEYIPPWKFEETFKNKIIMYLFEDVLKSRSNKLFSGIGDKHLTFGKICKKFDEIGLDIFSQTIRDCAKIEVNNSLEQEAED